MDYDDAALQRQYFWKYPIQHGPKRTTPQRSHSPYSPSSTPRFPGSPVPQFPASPIRSEVCPENLSLPRNLLFMGTYFAPDYGAKAQSNLIVLCREKATQKFFLAFIDIIYETHCGKLPAPIFEIYTLHLYDNYVVYERGSIRQFMDQYQSYESAQGITIHGVAALASDYPHTPELLAPQIFALEMDLSDPSDAINQIYHNQILVHKDSRSGSDLELLQKLIREHDLMFRYHRKIKTELKSQIQATLSLIRSEKIR